MKKLTISHRLNNKIRAEGSEFNRYEKDSFAYYKRVIESNGEEL